MSQSNKVKVVTHSSGFHTDDIFAIATLLMVLGEDNVEVTRSRDMEIAKSADYLVDYGGIDNPETNRFDHHQEGGAGKRQNGVPYASFGLVWKKYGQKLSGSREVSEKIDKIIVQPIDAGDNGVQFLETKIQDLWSFDIGLMTYLFSPTWKEDISKIDDVFIKLVTYAKFLLERTIISINDAEEGKKNVIEAYDKAPDKRIIFVDNSLYPVYEVLSKLPEPLYVVYENITAGTWSVKGIRNDLLSYDTRKKLPESWAGKTGSELEKITGVEGAVFCHNARFMAVAKTKEAILQMAEIALSE